MIIYFINFCSTEKGIDTIKSDDVFEYKFNLLLNIKDKIKFIDLTNTTWQKKVIEQYKTAIFKVIDRKILLNSHNLDLNEVEIPLVRFMMRNKQLIQMY